MGEERHGTNKEMLSTILGGVFPSKPSCVDEWLILDETHKLNRLLAMESVHMETCLFSISFSDWRAENEKEKKMKN